MPAVCAPPASIVSEVKRAGRLCGSNRDGISEIGGVVGDELRSVEHVHVVQDHHTPRLGWGLPADRYSHRNKLAMSSTAALRCNALAGIKRLAHAEPILPFLYNTRTIRRQHTDALSDFADSLEYRPQAPRRPQNKEERTSAPRIRGRREGGADYQQRQGPSSQRPFKRRAATYRNPDKSLDALPETSQDQDQDQGHYRKPREEHIPFEHADQETTSIREGITGSTMTPSEKKAFQELLSMPRRQRESSKTKERRNKLEQVLDDAVEQRRRRERTVDKPMPAALKQMQDLYKQDGNAAKRVQLHRAAEMDIKQVKEAFAAAQTDVELWQVLHEKVLSRVTSLDVDQLLLQQQSSPSSKQVQPRNKTKSKKAANEAPTPTTLPTPTPPPQSPWPGETPDALVIARTLPHHVTEAQRLLWFTFPASPLSLSILPYLKSLGPATFALAASTGLYNQHIRALRETGNFPAILHTLEEMDKEVFDFDDKTHDSLVKILRRQTAARKGTYGIGLEALWNGERTRKAVGGLGRWRGVVAERMQEKALREARAREELGGRREAAVAGGVDPAILSM